MQRRRRLGGQRLLACCWELGCWRHQGPAPCRHRDRIPTVQTSQGRPSVRAGEWCARRRSPCQPWFKTTRMVGGSEGRRITPAEFFGGIPIRVPNQGIVIETAT